MSRLYNVIYNLYYIDGHGFFYVEGTIIIQTKLI